MSEDKLTTFLKKSGLLGEDQKSAEKKPAPSNRPKKTDTKKPNNSKKPFNKNKGRQHRGGPMKSSNHDPHMARPTAEKREKFHPTNYIQSGKNGGKIRVVPLGGMEQVGQNMMFLEWDNDIIVIDTGFLFPSAEHLGVDVLLPNIEYLVKNKKKIRGILYTHGHLDHIGGTPYMVPELGFPKMYATKLTKELILANTEDEGIRKKYQITDINPKTKLKLGKFEVEFFHINHSIPDGVGIVVRTPYGAIVHTSDFKIDHHPSDDQPADLGRIAQIGKSGVALAMVDSTNALKPGYTISESVVENELAKVIKKTTGRLIITTFASSIGRISKVVEAAEQCGRTVFISGRSMEKNIRIAKKLNYLKCKEKTLHPMSTAADKMDPNKVLILSTGSQGEPLAALTRMAAGTHREIKLTSQDTILFSSSPIIGNEEAIVSVLNNLTEIGVNIIDKNQLDVYVSGHGYAEEVKLMTSLLNPKYFAPIHGEIYMRHGHKDLVVRELDFPEHNTFIMKNGQGVVLSSKGAELMTDKEKITAGSVMVELNEKINDHILADRTLMADGGSIFVSITHNKGSLKDIQIRARGFRYMHIEHDIFKLLEKELRTKFEKTYDPKRPNKAFETMLEQTGSRLFFQKFKREPLIDVIVQG